MVNVLIVFVVSLGAVMALGILWYLISEWLGE